MIKIRLSLKGKKKKRFFFIVVTNSKSPRDGKFLEKIGFYNPIIKKNIYINLKRLKYWISVGGKINNSVKKLIKNYKKL